MQNHFISIIQCFQYGVKKKTKCCYGRDVNNEHIHFTFTVPVQSAVQYILLILNSQSLYPDPLSAYFISNIYSQYLYSANPSRAHPSMLYT